MKAFAAVRSTVTVPIAPAHAFDVFTGEIDTWYRRGSSSLHAAGPASGLRIEPGVGGRLVEVPSDPAEPPRERGLITAWEPPARLVFVDHRDTEVEVRFEAIDGGTRVTLEHRGLDRLPDDVAARLARYGWQRLAGWFESYVDTRSEEECP